MSVPGLGRCPDGGTLIEEEPSASVSLQTLETTPRVGATPVLPAAEADPVEALDRPPAPGADQRKN